MNDVFAKVAAERRELADLLDGLTDEQWNAASLCAGWRMREVAAHVVMPFSLSLPRLFLKLAGNRFDFDRVADRWAKAEQRSNAELVSALRANVDHRFTPPGFGPEAPLTDAVVHGQDIRRPLGMATAVAPEHAVVVLDLLVSPKAARGFVRKGLVENLSLTATDADWTHGHGTPVIGSADSLITVLAGRSGAIDELSGDGVAMLRSRLAE
ncbi:MAG: hypothetical protein RLZZ623_2272 [Actinomycetota bacterium]|jgi:uncharacterized protein (TIGR03083 family)